MGKQSARLVYKGKDHKDIYFRGKYHDAMYLGYELLWHKIRKEGYYVFIVSNGKKSESEKGLYVITFDEKTKEFEIIMDVKDHPDMYKENFFHAASLVDGERIYISNVIEGDVVYSSIDGIHFGETNLKFEQQVDYYPFFSDSYHKYLVESGNGSVGKINYVWLFQNGLPSANRYYVRKFTIKKTGNDYTIEQKVLDTGLDLKSELSSINKTGEMFSPKYGESRFSLYDEHYEWETETGRRARTTIKYYDTEKEKAGEILKIEYLSFEQYSDNKRYYSRRIYTNGFYHVNNVYIFFLMDYKEVLRTEKSTDLYVYYSVDGITYNNSLIYTKKIPQLDSSEFPRIQLVLHRKGMYYMYANSEINEYYKPPYIVYLTTDFKHFQKKQIPREISVGGEAINTMKLIQNEAGIANNERRYFYNGEIDEPEEGILTRYSGGLIYIDNMFFRESNGNKVFNYLEV